MIGLISILALFCVGLLIDVSMLRNRVRELERSTALVKTQKTFIELSQKFFDKTSDAISSLEDQIDSLEDRVDEIEKKTDHEK